MERGIIEHRVTLDEAQTQLEYLIEAAVRGEKVFITKDAGQTVELVPVQDRSGRAQFGSGKELMVMADDFDEPLADFEEYM